MALKVAVQMDPLETINIAGDTTFLMMLTAQARGHSLWVYTPDRLSLDSGKAMARGRSVKVQDVKGDHATFGDWERRDLAEMDVVLLRQDPPFDMAYITATHVLDAIHPKTLVVNNPTEVRNAPEKLFVTSFPGVQPPTLITPTSRPSTTSAPSTGTSCSSPSMAAAAPAWPACWPTIPISTRCLSCTP